MLWAVAGLVLYILGGLATLLASLWLAGLVLASLGIETHAGTVGLSIRNSVHPIAWGALVAGASMPIGSRLVPGLRFGRTGWSLLTVGLALAAVTTFLVAEFVRARYGMFDPEDAGLSFFAGPGLVAIALAAWAALAVPRGQGLILVALTVTAAAGLAVSLLPSVGGAADGIDAASVPIVVALAADAAFAGVAALIVIARSTRSREA